MLDNRFTLLEQHLAEFRTQLDDVSGAMVVTLDGRILARNGAIANPVQIAAMTSSSLALGSRIINTIEGGELDEVTISGGNGNIFLYSIEKQAVLVVVTKKSPNIAMVNWEARKSINQMAALFY